MELGLQPGLTPKRPTFSPLPQAVHPSALTCGWALGGHGYRELGWEETVNTEKETPVC